MTRTLVVGTRGSRLALRQTEIVLDALRSAHGDRLQIIRVGVPDNQTAERQRVYVERRKIGGLHLFDRDGAAVRAFMVPHTSYVVVVDRTGEVVYTGQGADQDLSAAVRPVLPSR